MRNGVNIFALIFFGAILEFIFICGIIKYFISFHLVSHLLKDEQIKLALYPHSLSHIWTYLI